MTIPFTHVDLDDMRRRYLMGETKAGLASRYQVDRTTIHQCLQKMGIPVRRPAEAALLRM